ncbi:hypothetical protein A5792_16190 [Mycolicibacterium peregrinum]|uniref:Uncharacterized protein n=1 Tax=Mycolicibacterium peregrinum TaxID=43304 RepID=A0A1A0RCB6_MYCPR|nr:hypothetical protein A5792_16190 [Mycolicibacterium peregrinum]
MRERIAHERELRARIGVPVTARATALSTASSTWYLVWPNATGQVSTSTAGSDNIRDAWWSYGTGDMLERATIIGLKAA